MLRLDRIVVLTDADTPREIIWKGTEGAFLGDNEYAIDGEDLDSALEKDGRYMVGGGAAACFLVFDALNWLLEYGWN